VLGIGTLFRIKRVWVFFGASLLLIFDERFLIALVLGVEEIPFLLRTPGLESVGLPLGSEGCLLFRDLFLRILLWGKQIMRIKLFFFGIRAARLDVVPMGLFLLIDVGSDSL